LAALAGGGTVIFSCRGTIIVGLFLAALVGVGIRRRLHMT
jgi:hypothetical protein